VKIFKEPAVPVDQLFLLPPSVTDFVPEDAPVRLLSELIDQLDLEPLLKAYRGGGAPAFDPVMLFKVLVFGLSEGIRSSRRLAGALTYDVRYMYLARMSRPDFRTICRFRRSQGEAIVGLFAETVLLAKQMGLVLLEHTAVDGTKLRAQGSMQRYRKAHELDEVLAKTQERVVQLLKEMEETDSAEDDEHGDGPGDGIPDELRSLQERKKRYEQAKAEMEAAGARAVVTTEPESRMMKTADGVLPCYNAQAVVDSAAQIVVAAEVTQDAVDFHQLGPMLERAKQTVDALPEKVTADGGYWSKESLDYVDQQKLDAYIAPAGAKEDKLAGWVYDAERDVLLSPEGEEHVYSTQRLNRKRRYRGYRNPRTGKMKWLNEDAEQIAGMRRKVASPEGKAIYNRRKTIVEPVFGHIKDAYGMRRLLLRGKSGAKIEYLLACITHNLSKMAGANTARKTLSPA